MTALAHMYLTYIFRLFLLKDWVKVGYFFINSTYIMDSMQFASQQLCQIVLISGKQYFLQHAKQCLTN
jgi:hypothetical protein